MLAVAGIIGSARLIFGSAHVASRAELNHRQHYFRHIKYFMMGFHSLSQLNGLSNEKRCALMTLQM